MRALTGFGARVGTGAALGALCTVLVATPATAGAQHNPTPHNPTPHNPTQHKSTQHKAETPEHALVHWVNVQRQHAGHAALAPAAELTSVAHQHTAHMARLHRVFRDPYLGSEVHHWASIGEDVGSAASLADLEKALLATAANRVNLLGPGFRQIGVGIKARDGLLYVTVITRRPDSLAHH